MSSRTRVTIYTDGGCAPNPGRGGYGVVLLCGGARRELSGGYRRTTNNRMELRAVIAGLAALSRSCDVELRSDSQYIVNAVNQQWPLRWRAGGWRNAGGKPRPNHDLWVEFVALWSQHSLRATWVRGHAGDVENERAHQLAVFAMRRDALPADEPYEAIALANLDLFGPSPAA